MASREELDRERFVGDSPTRSLEDWHRLFTEDVGFPITSRRPVVGPLLVAVRKLLRPLARFAINDLFERQRVFDLIAIEKLTALDEQVRNIDQRLASLEVSYRDGLDEIMRYSDALYSRVDLKLDQHEETARQHVAALRSAAGGPSGAPSEAAVKAVEEAQYLLFENRQRGSRQEIEERVGPLLDELGGQEPVTDLGCGRGEVLGLLRERGLAAEGVDGSEAMVRACRERGLKAHRDDILEYLSSRDAGSLGALTCFHVVEHLTADVQRRLVTEAARVLRPGGILLVETPNPLSLRVGASSFWTDPTHRRPVHPEGLATMLEEAGFSSIEIRLRQRYPRSECLAEIDVDGYEGTTRELADCVNRIRDQLDELIHGHRDYAVLARR